MAISEQVPVELWIRIIREVTHLPEALDTNLHDALPPGGVPPGLYSLEVFAMIQNSLTTKLAISLVCKRWNSICLEFLYEIIIVRDVRYLPLLVTLLSRPHLRASKWVRRLDFVYAVPQRPTFSDGEAYSVRKLVRSAVRIVRLCRNLRVFSCRTTGDKESMGLLMVALPSGLMHRPDKLESIQWHPLPFADASLLLSLHRRCLCLRSMLLPDTRPPHISLGTSEHRVLLDWAEESADESDSDGTYEAPSTIQDGPLTFPSLHTLTLHQEGIWQHRHELPNGLPSLRHIIVGNMRPDLINSFISCNPQVDTLTFRSGALLILYQSIPITIRTVIFPLKDLSGMIHFPSAERVGLRGTGPLGPALYDYVFNQLLGEGEDELFPRLQLVRFVDAPLARILEKRNLQFKLLDRRCRSKGVRLEDDQGRLMVPRLEQD